MPNKVNYKKLNAMLFSEYRNTKDKKVKAHIERRLLDLNEKIIWKVVHNWNKKALPFSDKELYSFGQEALWKAIQKFDLSKGYQFSTFAINHVNGRILRAIRDEGCLIKIPQSEQIGKKITHQYIAFVPIDSEDINLQLEHDYEQLDTSHKIEQMLKVAKTIKVKNGNLRQAFTDCFNGLIDVGLIDRRKDNSVNRIDSDSEIKQLSLI